MLLRRRGFSTKRSRVKRQPILCGAVLLALSVAPLPAQTAQTNKQDDLHQRAIQLLRQTIFEQERRGARTNALPTARVPTFEELERQFLQGRITARQFQQLVQEHRLERAKPAPPPAPPAAKAVPATPVPPAAATNTPSAARPGKPDQAVVHSRLLEVEAKVDEMLKRKAEREKAATTNAPAPPAAAKTKRQRLDDLLRQLIDGKISDAEYQQQRTKIIGEPD
jgi:hypothetical protein